MPITIRALTPADRPDWELLFRAYVRFYELNVGADTERTVWGWIFDEHNDFWCDLAIGHGGAPIGLVQYQLMHRSLSGAMVCYLSDLYVEPALRGSGAGRALIDRVFAFARGRGLGNVRWLTREDNHAGRRLYDSYAPKTDFVLYSVPVAP